MVVTGFVDDATRADALAACTVFVQPSYFESYSMALTEAWVHRKPALVQGRCAVLDRYEKLLDRARDAWRPPG